MYGDSAEKVRLVENPNFERQTVVSIHPSVTVSLVASVPSTSLYTRDIVKVKQLSEGPSDQSCDISKRTPDSVLKGTETTSRQSGLKISETSNKLPDKTTRTSSEVDKKIELASDTSVPQEDKTSEIVVKKNDGQYNLNQESTQKVDKPSEKVETITEVPINDTGTASDQPDKNQEDNKMLLMPATQASTLSNNSENYSTVIRANEIEENPDPEQNCSQCVLEGKVCIGGCPNAGVKRNRSK